MLVAIGAVGGWCVVVVALSSCCVVSSCCCCGMVMVCCGCGCGECRSWLLMWHSCIVWMVYQHVQVVAGGWWCGDDGWAS